MVKLTPEEFKKHIQYDPVVSQTFKEISDTNGTEAGDMFLKEYISDQCATTYANTPQVNGFLYGLSRLTWVGWLAIALVVGVCLTGVNFHNSNVSLNKQAHSLGYVDINNQHDWIKALGSASNVEVKDVRLGANGGSKITITVYNHTKGEPLDLYACSYTGDLSPIGTDIVHLTPLSEGIVVANSKLSIQGAKYVYFYASNKTALN